MAFLSPLVSYICNLPSKGWWLVVSHTGAHLDSGAEIQQDHPPERRQIFIQHWPHKMDQIPWSLCQTLPKAHCHHLIDADALERVGVSTCHSRSTRLSRFSELMTMDLFSLCRLIMKLSEGPKTLRVSCLQGHFSQLFNLFNFNLI